MITINDDKTISQYIDEIIDKKLICFAGAGIDIDNGIPGWGDLLINMSEIPNLDSSIKSKINSNKDTNKYPDLAQELYQDLRNKGLENLYYETIRSFIMPKNSPHSTAQLEIVQTISWIITTNFSDTFDAAFKRKNSLQGTSTSTINIKSLPDLPIIDYSNNDTVIYIHGRADERCVIFKKKDFETFYPTLSNNQESSDTLEKYLNYIFTNYCLIFIGVSFEDYYFYQTLNNIHAKFEKSEHINSVSKPGYRPKSDFIKHYCFFKDNYYDIRSSILSNRNNIGPNHSDFNKLQDIIKMNNLINDLERIKINVVLYKNPIDWQYVFRKIKEYKKIRE